MQSKIIGDRAPREIRPCAHQGCAEPAVITQLLPQGLTEICETHALLHAQAEADEFCRNNALTTRELQIAYVREKLSGASLFKRIRYHRPNAAPQDNKAAAEYPPTQMAPSSGSLPNTSGPAGAAPDPDEQAAFAAWGNETAKWETEPPPEYPDGR
jgi:hypothetical protein